MEAVRSLALLLLCSIFLTKYNGELFPPIIRFDRSSNDTVRVAVILPNSTAYLSSINRVSPAIHLAVDKIKNRQVLPSWKWDIRYLDSQCSTDYGPMQAIRAYIEDRVHLFLGPVCDYVTAPIARLLKFWDVPLMTSGALARDYGLNKSHFDAEYYLLTRVGLSFNGVASFLLEIFKQFSWRKLLLLYDSKARSEIANEDYCVLWTKALVEYLRHYGNYTWQPYKLASGVSYEEAKKTLMNEIGVNYGNWNHLEKKEFENQLSSKGVDSLFHKDINLLVEDK